MRLHEKRYMIHIYIMTTKGMNNIRETDIHRKKLNSKESYGFENEGRLESAASR